MRGHVVTVTRRSNAPLPICETDALIVRLKKLERRAGSDWNQDHITLRGNTLIGAATMIADSGALLAYSLDQYLVGKRPLPRICAAWGKATKLAFLAVMTVALGLFFPEVPRQFYRDMGLAPRPSWGCRPY